MDTRVLRVELEITLRCNLDCSDCNRYSGYSNLPLIKNSDMSIDDIKSFISQVTSKNIILNHLTIMGGEPTVHPNFNEITYLLYSELLLKGFINTESVYLAGQKRFQGLQVYTNAIKPVKKIKRDLIKYDSILKEGLANKSLTIKQATLGFNESIGGATFGNALASPADYGVKVKLPKKEEDFGKIGYCHIPFVCGIAVNKFGYFPCGPGGSVARLLDIDGFAKKELPLDIYEAWPHLEDRLCKDCNGGHALEDQGYTNLGISPTFKKALKNYS